ncbi:MAG: glycerol dehydrogenase [Halanaeroarchaeum sp.]
MSTRLLAPGSYVQGDGVLTDGSVYEGVEGSTAFVFGGETAIGTTGDRIRTGIEAASMAVADVVDGVDTCTFDRIEHLSDRARVLDADVVVGVGGGVALDTSKAVAETIDASLVTVPTIASTDAPCSSVAVVYDVEGNFDGYVHRDRDPDLVVVDTGVIANAPTRFLRYGMGDAFATRFEAEAVRRSQATTHAGGHSTNAALTLARTAYDTIATYGEEAIGANERNAVTPAFERVVEANTLLSGMGFESGGLAAAHAFGKGFSRSGADAPHGLLIAFSTIAQLVLEDRDPGVLEEALSVYRSLGLERRLSDFDIDDETVDDVAREACREDTTMDNMPGTVSAHQAAAALRTADELVANR